MANELVEFKKATAGLSENKAQILEKALTPMLSQLKSIENDFNNIVSIKEIDNKTTIAARDLRLKIAKIRIATEKVRKKEKADIVLAGRAVDGMANIIKHQIVSKEEKLKDIEEYLVRKKHQAILELGEQRNRELFELCQKYNNRIDPVPEIEELGKMDDTSWYRYLKGTEHELFEIAEAEEKERKRQEEERKAELERQEALRKKAAEEEEKRRKLERELERKEQERLAAEKKLREEKEKQELALKRELERKEQERLAAEQEAERKARLPDINKIKEFSEKLINFIDSEMPVLASLSIENKVNVIKKMIEQLGGV